MYVSYLSDQEYYGSLHHLTDTIIRLGYEALHSKTGLPAPSYNRMATGQSQDGLQASTKKAVLLNC